MNLAAFLGIDPSVLQLLTALIGLVAATATTTSTVHGILNRRMRKRTEATATSTDVAVKTLVKMLGEQKTERDSLWAAFLAKDTVANPEGVRRIALEAVQGELLPIREFFRATEIVEKHRTHRPETDVIAILEGASAV